MKPPKLIGHPLINVNDIRPVAGGYSRSLNFSYKNEFFIKLFPKEQTQQNRINEIKFNQLASKYSLAPSVFFINNNFEIAITDFIKGDHPDFNDYQNPAFIKKLLDRIHQLHSIQPTTLQKALKPIERFKIHLKNVKKQQIKIDCLDSLQEMMPYWQSEADKRSEGSCFIHDDLNSMNIIKSEANLLFVDWANSGMGSPFCDLAEVAVFLEPEKHVDLMKQYRNNKIERHDHELLTLHWRMRLGLFAAWALEEAAYRMKEPISRIDYPASKDHYLTLLKNILNGRETLSTGQDFLLFSSAMLSAVIASNIDDHWK